MRRISAVRVIRVLGAFVIAASQIVGCSTAYVFGSSPAEQLCNVLQPTLALVKAPDEFLIEPALEDAARDPSDLPSELLAINVAYRTKQDAYDQLGPYEAAIEFTASIVDLAQGQLMGPSTLSPKVRESALAIDRALQKGTCA